MIYQRFVTQPHNGAEYRSLLSDALQRADFTSVDSAIAYATMPGVRALRQAVEGVAGGRWGTLQKRWLVGIDLYRSQPAALDALAAFAGSQLAVPDGLKILQRQRCNPLVSYHPKTYIFSGPDCMAVVSGSGNLSYYGLTSGHEVGSLLLIKNPTTASEQELWENLHGVKTWFDAMWPTADPLATVRNAYKSQYESPENLRAPTPSDDDATTSAHTKRANRPQGFGAEELRQLRAATFLWIQAGNVTKNRGDDKPGNQLMMRRMSRVFFDLAARDVPENTGVGEVGVRVAGGAEQVSPMRFSDNSMDVLTLPIPEDNGFGSYDGKTLLFERRADGTFELMLLSDAQARAAQRHSRSVNGLFRMKSGRRFGIY